MMSPVEADTRSISRGPLTPPEDHESMMVEQDVIFPIGVLIWILFRQMGMDENAPLGFGRCGGAGSNGTG